uniref:Uncharacterized protein n=1 Tax=Anguilla anguilla TaxID=7936 RepID=A0A0E9TN43_ANGAN
MKVAAFKVLCCDGSVISDTVLRAPSQQGGPSFQRN